MKAMFGQKIPEKKTEKKNLFKMNHNLSKYCEQI